MTCYMYMIFTILTLTICDYFTTISYGTSSYTVNMRNNTTLCINGRSFPFYLVFENKLQNVQYTEKQFVTPSKDTIQVDYAADGENISFVRPIVTPYSDIQIKAYEDTVVEFSSICFPAGCSSQMIFSSYGKQLIHLSSSPKNEPFTKIGVLNDICIIPTSKSLQTVHVSGKYSHDRIAFCSYQNILYDISCEYHRGDGSYTKDFGGSSAPPILRLITDEHDNHYFNVTLTSNQTAKYPTSFTYFPSQTQVSCIDKEKWYDNDNLALFLVACTCIFGFVTLIMIVLRFTKFNH